MVPQTRSEYGFIGYQVPVFPRASRSARVRVPIKKKSGKNQKRAFEILVSVAGELLQEQEGERQSSKFNLSDQETCDEKTSINYRQIYTLNKFSCAPDRFNLKACSNLKSFDQLANVSGRNANLSAAVGIPSLVSPEFFEGKLKDAGGELSIIQTVKSETLPLTGSLDVLERDRKPSSFFCSDSKAYMFKDWLTFDPSRHSNAIEMINRDDEKNYFGCSQAATTLKAFRVPSNIADRGIKNLSSSRYWRVSSNLNGGASIRNDGKRRMLSHDGRTSYGHRRSKRISPFERRCFFNHLPFSGSDRGFQLDDRFNSANKRSDGDNSSAAIRVGSSIASPRNHLVSRERNVKIRIKSFTVPELLVEIPTTATVGSLKRTVTEAVTTVLGDGLRVSILLQGKKVRGDGKTLLQTGISRDGKHRNLGFLLEPRNMKIIPPPCLGERRITRHATFFTLEPGTAGVSLVPPLIGCNHSAESDLHLIPNISTNSNIPSSQSVLSISAISVEALTLVPVHHRARRHEFVQRRIRRPFSVSEVEALVQAVEKLGTGRWREVKVRAFDNAKHRTYVDLKDKWKTLIHTARISPQQRRGEPLPQELLDRVLAVHAYWSKQQATQQLESGV
ncbi:telomere repeat-binding protein 5-like [Hibiscus syriacus]|uniref:telomere repeat-binding protein 5-like n=1 Tax=Hibiscus syriacus TaxID=106335 RepID=UPI001922031E|nr:telomere repeat-binding protein 5-like [Hibiscus syriacus]